MTRDEYAEFVADFKPVFDTREFLFAEVETSRSAAIGSIPRIGSGDRAGLRP